LGSLRKEGVKTFEGARGGCSALPRVMCYARDLVASGGPGRAGAVLNLKPHHERVVRLLEAGRYCDEGVRDVGRCVCTGSCKGAIPRAILGS